MLRYLEVLRCEGFEAYRSAEDRTCGERCRMCPSLAVVMCSWLWAQWLARLFDLECRVESNSVPWSQLLERVARRLSDDAEPEYMAHFPWPLWNLPVRSIVSSGSRLCCLVVEHLCCEAYKIAHDHGRWVLRV